MSKRQSQRVLLAMAQRVHRAWVEACDLEGIPIRPERRVWSALPPAHRNVDVRIAHDFMTVLTAGVLSSLGLPVDAADLPLEETRNASEKPPAIDGHAGSNGARDA